MTLLPFSSVLLTFTIWQRFIYYCTLILWPLFCTLPSLPLYSKLSGTVLYCIMLEFYCHQGRVNDSDAQLMFYTLVCREYGTNSLSQEIFHCHQFQRTESYI